jgi:hypothetical protein
MNDSKKNEDKLIEKINLILQDFKNFEKAKINLQGDIIIKQKSSINKTIDKSILTDVFKKMISNDIKKNRV